MIDRAYLALDQGTHSSRAILFDASGRELEKARVPVRVDRIDGTRVEQDPAELLASLRDVLRAALRFSERHGITILGAGLATQRSSIVLWDRSSGTPLSPVLSWQDRRAGHAVENLEPHRAEIRARSGLPLTAHYSASKMRWLLDESRSRWPHPPERLGIAPLATYFVDQLTSDAHKYCIDHSNALRTQLMSLQDLDWDPWLVERFGLDGVPLPRCVPVIANYGTLDGTSISLNAVIGDQGAAMFSEGALPPGSAIANLGTGGFLLAPCAGPDLQDETLLGGLSVSDEDGCEFLIEGTVNGCGAALAWAENELAIEASSIASMERALESADEPLIFVNSVGGIGSPWWITEQEPYWCDMHGTKIESPRVEPAIAAVLESIVFLLHHNYAALDKIEPISHIRVGGGLALVDGICHRLASLTKCRVTRSFDVEATASGVAWLAADRPRRWRPDATTVEFAPRRDDGLARRAAAMTGILQQLRGRHG